jgi:hypothetical protein
MSSSDGQMSSSDDIAVIAAATKAATANQRQQQQCRLERDFCVQATLPQADTISAKTLFVALEAFF